VAGITITIDTIAIETVTVVGAPAGRLHWHIGPVLAKEALRMPQEVTLTREQQCRFHVTPLTAGGQPAPLDGPVQFSIAGTCTLDPIDDTSVWVVAPAAGIGDSVLTVQADADLGAGVVPLMDSATIHVVDPMASSLGLEADAPELKPIP
jgi:hypothetical protein